MLSEQFLVGGDGSSIDTGNPLTSLTSSLSDALMPFIWLSVVLTIVFIVLYVSSMLRKRKVENAILDIQKTIHEMNERDKARSASTPRVQPQKLPEKEPIIAHASEPEEVV